MSVKIIFSTQDKFFSDLIRYVTWSSFSHVDMIMEDRKDQIIGATALQGVTEWSLQARKDKATRWAIYEVDTISRDDDENIYRCIRSQLNKPYDFFGILGYFCRRDWQHEEKWFCSELVAWAFAKVHIHLLAEDIRMSRIAPQDLLMSPKLELVEASDDK
jgi:uncharacterized protein YycO